MNCTIHTSIPVEHTKTALNFNNTTWGFTQNQVIAK